MIAGHDLAELHAEFAGDGAFLAGADLDVVAAAWAVDVDGVDADDFGGGAGEEDFVGLQDFVEAHFLDDALDADHRAEFGADEAFGDAFEAAAVAGGVGRRVDHAILDDEDVVARALGDPAVGGEHDGLVAAGFDGFDLGEDVVEVIQALDAGIKALAGRFGALGDDHAHAFVVELGFVQANLVGDADHAGDGAAARIQAQRAIAAADHEADVALVDRVGADAFALDGFHFLARDGDLEVDLVGAFVEAIKVLLALEDLALVNPDAFEDAVAVEQAVVVDADHRLALGDHAAVDPDQRLVADVLGGGPELGEFGEINLGSLRVDGDRSGGSGGRGQVDRHRALHEKSSAHAGREMVARCGGSLAGEQGRRGVRDVTRKRVEDRDLRRDGRIRGSGWW